MTSESGSEQRAFLSTEIAGPRAYRLAMTAVLISTVFFVTAVPFAKVPLAHVPAFIAAYESALIICDVITAVLLFGQFSFLRSRAMLVLACGYLFTALLALAHALTYPNLFAPGGLIGGGSQSTAWLYFFWHGSFPVFVIAYALLKHNVQLGWNEAGAASEARGGSGVAILAGVLTVFSMACGFTIIATAFHDYLPVLMAGHQFSSALNGLPLGVSLLSILALLVLYRRAPHSVLDLWLMVVLCAWFFNMALGAVFNNGRFDFGFYAGRIYGLLAASFVLIVLLFENSMHYARLVQLSLELRTANKALELLSVRDGLTGIANRRFFDSYLDEQIAIARRHKRTLSLVMCDVDSFKAYNDHYGHPAGDECLKQVAAALRSCCRRPADVAARYGGEEFALILPDTGLSGATAIAETARDALALLDIPHARSAAAAHVSISGGVAVLQHEIEMTAQQLIKAADESLFQAKSLGRNRMIAMQESPG